MNASPLDELDEVSRRAVELSRQSAVPERALAAALERIATRVPATVPRARWREPIRWAIAAGVLLAAVLFVNQAPAAWAEVAEMQVEGGAASAAPAGRRPLTGLLLVHVVSLLAGYAAYLLAWLLSLAVLVAMLFKDASRLLRVTVRISAVLLALGVLLMLLAIVLGAVWAKPNLGRYWDWDVKESNGLATLLFGVAWLALTYRHMRMEPRHTLGEIEPGVVSAVCFWASMAGWWWIAYVGNGVFLWQTGVFICLCVLLNAALIVGARWTLSSAHL
jgi:hypothetical protein